MKSVALVVSHVSPVLGMERCVLRLLEQLDSDLDLVCLGEDLDDLDALGLRAQVLGGPLRGFGRLRSLLRLRRWAVQDRHRTILVAGAWVALPLLLVAPRGRRIVVWEHSFSAEKIDSSRTLRLLARLAAVLYRRAEAVVCVSPDLGRQLQQRIPVARTVVVPNYLGPAPVHDDDVARPLFPAGARRLLTVGSLSATKNQQLVIRALAELGPDHVLVVAGAGALRGDLEDLVRELGLSAQVLFLGHIADPAPWYRWAEVVVQPAHGETFGLAMFEAAAHHRPVVCLDYGLARDLIGTAVPGATTAATAQALAAAVRGVLSAPPSVDEHRRAAEVRATTYAPQEISRQWADVLGLSTVGQHVGGVR